MLVDFLRANADIFAWSHSDMPGIPREVAEHSLDVRPNSKPVKQRLRRFNELKWTRLETWRSYTLRVISSPCEDTKRREFDAETSTKGTWC